MPKLKVYATLAEHFELGNVWLDNSDFITRSIARITRKNNNKKNRVWCETQRIDKNYLKSYNDTGAGRWHINEPEGAIVMSKWYRDKLGISTQEEYEFEIERPNPLQKLYWGLKVSCQHPQSAVRLATKLAIVSVALGIIGFILGIISICR
jgi:hypothetical protein